MFCKISHDVKIVALNLHENDILPFPDILSFLNVLAIVFSSFGEKLVMSSHTNMATVSGDLTCFITMTFNTSYTWFNINLTGFLMNFSSFSKTIALSQFTALPSSDSLNMLECPAKTWKLLQKREMNCYIMITCDKWHNTWISWWKLNLKEW